MSTKRLLQLTITLVITALLLWLLLREVSVAQIAGTIRQLPLGLLVLGFALFAASHLVRALRFRMLLRNAQPYRIVLAVTCIHNILLALLPFRLGELSFPYLFQRKKIPFTKSLAALAVGRLFDLFSLTAYFLVGLWMLLDVLPENIRGLGKYAIALAVVLIFGTYLTLVHLKPLLRNIRTRKGKFWHTVLQKFHELLDGIAVLKEQHALWQVFLMSLVIWGLQFLWSWMVFREMLNANFWGVVVGTSVPIISTAIPIQGLASFGTFEGVWALVFLAFGVEKALAIASGFAFHLISIVYAAVLGALGGMVFTRSELRKR